MNHMGENYDATWLDYESYRYAVTPYNETPKYGGSSYILTTSSSTQPLKGISDKEFKDYLRKISNLPPQKQEAPVAKTEQQEIDEAVREAIEAPRREAEIAKRVAAVTKLGTEDKYDDGTVLSWDRKYGTKTYSYAAIKVVGRWFVTGNQSGPIGNGLTYEALVEWMTTGENLITNLRVATGWETIL